MNQELKDILEQEERTQRYLDDIKCRIVASVSNAVPITGVKRINNADVSCVTVQFSALVKGNLSPPTYIPESQGEAVKRRIASCATVRSLLDVLRQITNAGYIRFSNGEQVTLNENTIKVLSDCIGK